LIIIIIIFKKKKTKTDKLLEREGKIELLVEKTETMEQQSTIYYKTSRELKRAMWIKNLKLTFILIIVILVLGWLLLSFICGFTFKHCFSSSSSSSRLTNSTWPF